MRVNFLVCHFLCNPRASVVGLICAEKKENRDFGDSIIAKFAIRTVNMDEVVKI